MKINYRAKAKNRLYKINKIFSKNNEYLIWIKRKV